MRRRRLQAKARVLARAGIDGSLGPAELCLSLSPYTSWVPEYFSEEEKILIKAINSETDDLPVGRLAENWHPDFLPARLEQLARFETQIAPQVRSMCEQILVRAGAASGKHIDDAA